MNNNLNFSLEDTQKENFNQFQLNDDKFNVKSSYTENIYTTEIDYEKITDDLVQRANSLEYVKFC